MCLDSVAAWRSLFGLGLTVVETSIPAANCTWPENEIKLAFSFQMHKSQQSRPWMTHRLDGRIASAHSTN